MGRNIGVWQIVILLLIVVLLFGARRLPDLARNLGKSMKIMKEEVRDLRDDPATADAPTANTPPAPAPAPTDAAPPADPDRPPSA